LAYPSSPCTLRTLHARAQVTSILACTLDAGSNGIVGHLFGDCDLLGWLLDAPAQVMPERRPGDTRCVIMPN
jgi:hypothetical protein